MDNKERIIRDIKDAMIEVNRLLSRDTLSVPAIQTLAIQLNQANNWAQMLRGMAENSI